jgi:hypothetical protein
MTLYHTAFKDRINDPNGVNITEFLNNINCRFNTKLTGDSTISDEVRIALTISDNYR